MEEEGGAYGNLGVPVGGTEAAVAQPAVLPLTTLPEAHISCRVTRLTWCSACLSSVRKSPS